jgi:molybdopterin/thiamine biosynthesis adenylyltransferase
MIWILALGALFWMLGGFWGLTAARRGLVLLAASALVMALHLALAEGHVLRVALGGDAKVWLVVGVVIGGVWAYAAGLGALRARGKAMETAMEQADAAGGEAAVAGAYAPGEVARYARHILLREIGGPGQKRLKAARILVVGAGGLGSPALLYLAAAGVGVIGVVDDDQVERSNLQRQIIHGEDRIGMAKVASAALAMKALNPFVEVRAIEARLGEANGAALFADYDLILDGTDNFDTRYLVNRLAVAAGKPLISAAITQWEGQMSLYDPARGAPCYDCVFPVRPEPGMVPTCAEAGVVAPLPGVLGAMMALEAIKEITGAGEGLRGRLLIHDALFAETRMIRIERRADCAVCGAGH